VNGEGVRGIYRAGNQCMPGLRAYIRVLFTNGRKPASYV
jgi:hypothetical protein